MREWGTIPLHNRARMRKWRTFHWKIDLECETVAHSNPARSGEAHAQLGCQNARVGRIPLENQSTMRVGTFH
jgi:hypothetical protein